MISLWETGKCKNYPYYSTRCTISENDFKIGTAELDRQWLITEIKPASRMCTDLVDQVTKGCGEKVALESGYNRVHLKDEATSLEIECYLNYKIVDCFQDFLFCEIN